MRVSRDPAYAACALALLIVAALSATPGIHNYGPQQATDSGAASQPEPSHQTGGVSTASYAAMLLDARRVLDLDTVGHALAFYRLRNGTYPSSHGLYSELCTYGFDAGCLLTPGTRDLPATDGQYAYWYQSDGQSYTLVARHEAPLAQTGCPSELPDAFAGVNAYCLTSEGVTP